MTINLATAEQLEAIDADKQPLDADLTTLAGGAVPANLQTVLDGQFASIDERPDSPLRYIDTAAELVTDWTTAINAAIGNGGKVVELPPLRGMRLGGPVAVKDNTRVQGHGPQATQFVRTDGTGGGAMFRNDDTTNGNTNISLSGFALDGNSAGQSAGSGTGIYTIRVSNLYIDNVEVYDVDGVGFLLQGRAAHLSNAPVNPIVGADFSHLYAHDCTEEGIWIKSGYRGIMASTFRAVANGGTGIRSDHSEGKFTHMFADGNGLYGIFLDNLHGGSYFGLHAIRNASHGIYCESVVRSIGSHWLAQSNGKTVEDSADVYLSATTRSYGEIRDFLVDGIWSGHNPLLALDGEGTTATEEWSIYVADNVGTAERPVKLTGVFEDDSIAGMRLPADQSGIVVSFAGAEFRPKIDLPASVWSPLSASPTFSTGSAIPPRWLFTDAQTDGISVVVESIPDDWTTADLVVTWKNDGAGSGDVVLNAGIAAFGDGDAEPIIGFTSVATETAAAEDVKSTTTFAGLAVTPGQSNWVQLRRNGGAVGDTLTNDIAFYSAKLVRAT